MEVYNEDNPSGETILASTIQLSTNDISFQYENNQEAIEFDFEISSNNGNTGNLIKSVEIDNTDYSIVDFSNTLIGANENINLTFNFSNTTVAETNAVITVIYDNNIEEYISVRGEKIVESLIESLTFFNNVDNTTIAELNDRGTYNFNGLETVNIVMNTSETIRSAEFILSGEIDNTQVESHLPLDAFGTGANNGVTFPNGQYVLLVNIYSLRGANGVILESTEFAFTVTGNSISISPNPTSDNLTIDVSETGKVLSEINIQDLTGTSSLSFTTEESQTEQGIHLISVQNLTTGTYILSLVFEDGSVESSQIIIE